MTNEEFMSTVRPLHEARPFHPFFIEMNDGTCLEIDIPGALGYRDGIFGVMTAGRGPRVFKCSGIRNVVSKSAEKAAA